MALNILSNLNRSDSFGIFPKKENCSYSAFYCEENIWMLLKTIQKSCPEKLPFCHAVFISNENTYIPLWRQSLGKEETGFVVWDYHVIMVYSNEEDCLVFDFDTQLPFPSLFHEYCKETFKSEEYDENPLHLWFFRVISAEKYLNFFASDRRHMKNEDGTWKKPPPNYPAIRNSVEVHNFPQYISMKPAQNESSIYGNVLNLKSFIDKFSFRNRQCTDYMFPPDPLPPTWLE